MLTTSRMKEDFGLWFSQAALWNLVTPRWILTEKCVTNELFDVGSLLMPDTLCNEKDICLSSKGVQLAPETQNSISDG